MSTRRNGSDGARAFGRQLKTTLRSRQAWDLLDRHPEIAGGTWLAGGCSVLASALTRLDPTLQTVGIVDRAGIVHHILVHRDGWFFDGDGASREKTLLKRWRDVELIDTPRVVFDPQPIGIPCPVDAVRELSALLREHLDSVVDNPLVLRDYADYCEEIARRYDTLPELDEGELWRWQLLIESVEDFYDKMTRDVEVRFVPGQPYDTAKQMRDAVRKTGVLEISTEANEHPVFTPEQNLKFRAVHDYIVHILPGPRGPDFTRRGEIRAYNLHRRLAPKKSWPALFTEVAAQACYVNARGEFPTQKVAVVPGVDFYNVSELSGFDVQSKTLVERNLARRLAAGG